MPLPIPKTEVRSADLLRQHYEIEKELANRLRRSSKQERTHLYSEVYDEFFAKLTHLPQNAENTAARSRQVSLEAQALELFLTKDSVFLEIGAGDCALAVHLADKVHRSYAIEASVQATKNLQSQEDFELILTDSLSLPFADASIDVAYSCHFLEHLHPDDAYEHAAEVRRVLRSGGVYLCVTPNRLWGPHDISRYFDDTPTGFHLREYTHADLSQLFLRADFASTKVLCGVGQTPRVSSGWRYALAERVLDLFPIALRRQVMALLLGNGQAPFRKLEQVAVLACK